MSDFSVMYALLFDVSLMSWFTFYFPTITMLCFHMPGSIQLFIFDPGLLYIVPVSFNVM